MPKLKMSVCGALLTTSILGMPAVSAHAAEAVANQDDVLIVTARKREETLIEVPMSITAFSEKFLEDLRVNSLEDALQYAANVDFDDFQNDSFTGSIAIRGVVRLTDVEEPGYGLYKDGVYIGSSVVGLDEFTDLERLEILKGPQGGLYGRNAIGGAINVITNQPVNRIEGRFAFTAANFDRQEYRGTINVPIIADKFLVRINGFLIDQDGGKAVSSVTGDQLDAVRSAGLRGQAKLLVNDDIDVTWTAEWLDADQPAAIILSSATTPPGEDEGALVYSSEHGVKRDVLHLYQTLNWRVGEGTFTNIVSFRSMDVDSRTGFAPFVGTGGAVRQSEQDNWFVEARYVSDRGENFDYVVGLNYINESSDFYRILNLPIGMVPDNPPALPPNFINLGTLSPITSATTDTRSWAGFVEATWHVSDKIDLTGSARYTNERKTYDFFVETPSAIPFFGTGADIGVGAPIFFPGFQLQGAPWFMERYVKKSWNNFSPQGTLSYRPNDKNNIYARIATGFKAGGFNNEASRAEDIPFDPEKSLTYELGYKGLWLDDLLQVNLSAFVTKRKDAAILVADPAPIFQFLGVSIVANGGKTITKGVEFDFLAKPIKGLELYGALGYLNAKFDGAQLISGVNVDGNLVPQTAKWSYSTVATYRAPVSEALKLFTQASYSSKSGGYERPDNVLRLEHADLVNFRLGLEADAWRITGYVDNAFDDRVKLSQRTNGMYILSAPRRFGLQLEYSW